MNLEINNSAESHFFPFHAESPERESAKSKIFTPTAESPAGDLSGENIIQDHCGENIIQDHSGKNIIQDLNRKKHKHKHSRQKISG